MCDESTCANLTAFLGKSLHLPYSYLLHWPSKPRMIPMGQLDRDKVRDEYRILRPITTRRTDAHLYEKNVDVQ
jgi:hypothetical protein